MQGRSGWIAYLRVDPVLNPFTATSGLAPSSTRADTDPLTPCGRGCNARPRAALSPWRWSVIPTTSLAVGGMACSVCARHVMKALDGMNGVVGDVELDLQKNEAIVEHVEAQVDAIALAAAVRDAGYSVRIQDTAADEDWSLPSASVPVGCGCGSCESSLKSIGEWTNLGTSTIG